MPDGMRIEDGIWIDDDNHTVLPGMVRAPGENGYFYFAPLKAVEAKASGTLTFDARDVRAALAEIGRQMKCQGTRTARQPRRRRASMG
jgi:hypothetical protein